MNLDIMATAHGNGNGNGHGYDNGPGKGPGNGNGYGHNKPVGDFTPPMIPGGVIEDGLS